MVAHTIIVGEHSLPLTIRKHPRSRRMIIRYQPLRHTVMLTLPPYVTVRQGLSFIEARQAWIAAQIKEHAATVMLADGVVIPVLGTPLTIRHVGGRGVLRVVGDELHVPGNAAFLSRRLYDWLKRRVKEEIAMLAHAKGRTIGKKVIKIGLRDTSSHWGSCNSRGCLSFSWRLVFAPYAVLEYVVSHEVAHLACLDHSPTFWQVVASLSPDYLSHRAWLKANGHALYRFSRVGKNSMSG